MHNKKLQAILIWTFLLSLPYCLQAQQYYPFPDSNAIWKTYYNNHIIPPPPWWYTDYYETYYDGDTVIGPYTYKKIMKIELDVYCLTDTIAGPEYMGALRDDIQQKKVYFILKDHDTDTLLYDFNLEVGDTIPLGFNTMWCPHPLTIAYIDSVLINQEYRKRFYIQYYMSIIEGIGSETGLLEELCPFEGGHWLCAFNIDTLLIYGNGCDFSYTDTCLLVEISELISNDLVFSVYPNPVTDKCAIEISGANPGAEFYLEIFNATGVRLTTIRLSNNNQIVNISFLVPGLYLFKIFIDNNICLSNKVIIN